MNNNIANLIHGTEDWNNKFHFSAHEVRPEIQDSKYIISMHDNKGTTMTVYQVYDGQTGAIIGNYSTRSRASNKVDKLDNEYGAYRYHVRIVTVEVKAT